MGQGWMLLMLMLQQVRLLLLLRVVVVLVLMRKHLACVLIAFVLLVKHHFHRLHSVVSNCLAGFLAIVTGHI